MIASSSSSSSSSSYCCLILIQSIISICCCSAARSILAGETSVEHPNLDVRPQRLSGELNFQVGSIGSRPPTCANKCNSCSPCQAVQVPTPLGHWKPSASSAAPTFSKPSFSSPPQGSGGESTATSGQVFSEYSNYKPEGWKCKCGNKLFNP